MAEQSDRQELLWFVIDIRSKSIDAHEFIEEIILNLDKEISMERIKSLMISALDQIVDLESAVQQIIRKNVDEIVELIANKNK